MVRKADPFWETVESFGVGTVFALPEWIENIAGETPPEPPGDAMGEMEILRGQIDGCMKCPLGRTRKNIVFGEGNPRSGILVIGEGPGATEDETGRPFVGRSGKLLDKIFESIGLNRECLFIANIVKCRPPNNRAPLPPEAEACGKYLHRQMEIMKPGIIVALGASAARHILDTKRGIGVLREEFHTFREVPVLVTYHPAALLRSPLLKRPVWEDMKKLKAFLDRAGLPRNEGN